MNICSAGILLGVALLHIFPETGEALNSECGDYPLSYVITFIAIILMTFLLKTGHNHSHSHDEEEEDLLEDHDHIETADGKEEESHHHHHHHEH